MKQLRISLSFSTTAYLLTDPSKYLPTRTYYLADRVRSSALVASRSNLGQDTNYAEAGRMFPQSLLVHTGIVSRTEAQ
jgi:hypothetical protein